MPDSIWVLVALGVTALGWAVDRLMSGPDVPTIHQTREQRRDRR
jgi:hypothetical protein